MSKYFLGINLADLPDYSGLLSDALIPVLSATDGELYKIVASNVLVGGQSAIHQVPATGGDTETVAALHGKVVLMVFRGNSKAGDIIYAGSPNPQQVKWDSATDISTAPDGNPWLPTESLTFLYLN